MALFVIIGHDVADSTQKRQATRAEHLQRLEKLSAENRLVIAGPTPIEHDKPQMSGSLIIAEFADLADAQAWCNEEPYLKAGVYSHVEIKPFIQALPKLEPSSC